MLFCSFFPGVIAIFPGILTSICSGLASKSCFSSPLPVKKSSSEISCVLLNDDFLTILPLHLYVENPLFNRCSCCLHYYETLVLMFYELSYSDKLSYFSARLLHTDVWATPLVF